MRIAVLGAGTMGHGIAQVSAMAGHDVTLRDIDQGILDDGLEAIRANLEGGVERDKVSRETMNEALDNLSATVDLAEATEGAELVIEAVPEDMGLKQDVFTEVETHVDDSTVIATNTSSLSVTEIASVLDDAGRSVGLHFFNPVHIMGLVEIVVAEQTRDDVVSSAESYVDDIEKTAVVINDVPGFATSRLGVTIGVEAIRMVEQGVGSPDDIDTAMRLGYNHPMGPLELTDHVGLDVRLDVLTYLRDELGERFRPPQLLKRKVNAGNLGRKTGEGFYVWEDGEIVGPADD